MKIKRVIINNYGSFYGRHEFVLDGRGLTLIMGDNQDDPRQNSNGAAKSTIFEAPDWCLFGVVPRNDTVDSIINDEAGKDCFVTTELEDDDHLPHRQIRVTRFRKMNGKENGVSLAVDDKELTALDSAETDKRIEQVLGLDREVFHALVFYQQGDRFNFADAKDSERVEILTKVLQLNAIDEWLERFTARRATVQGKLTELEKVVVGETARRDALKQTDYSALMERWATDHGAQVHVALANVEQLRQHMEGHRNALIAFDVPALQKALAEAQAQLPQPDPAVTSKMSADKQQGRQAINKLREHLGGLTSAEVRLRGQITHAESTQGAVCPTCGQALPVTITPEQHLGQLRLEMGTTAGQIEQARANLLQWEGWLTNVEAAEKAYADGVNKAREAHTGAVSAAASQLDHARHAEVSFKTAEAQHVLATQELGRIQAQVNPYQEQQANLAMQLAAAEESITKATFDAEQCRTGLSFLEFWVGACGPKGVKSYVLDARLAELNDAINVQLKLLFGGILWARVETQTMGRSSGTLSNKINIRLFRHNPDGTITERNYRSWSIGEKHRISVAIDMGLSRLVASRSTKRYGLLILDEVFEHLDSRGRDAVVEMLHQLQTEKSSIFVIDHDAEFQGAFHSRVTVTKKNRRSTIAQEEVKRGEQVQAEAAVQPQSNGSPPQQPEKAVAPNKASVRRGGGGGSRKRKPVPDPVH